MELSPDDPRVLNGYAWYLMDVEGRSEEAVGLSERYPVLAPFDLYIRAERARLIMFARRYESALEEFERLRAMDPDFRDRAVAESYMLLGRFEDAHRARIEFWEQCGSPCDWERQAAERGWSEGGWEGSLRTWLEAATGKEVSPWRIAVNYARIGERDEAFSWLERGYRERDPRMTDLRSFPEVDPLRSDPRFQDLLRRIGVPET